MVYNPENYCNGSYKVIVTKQLQNSHNFISYIFYTVANFIRWTRKYCMLPRLLFIFVMPSNMGKIFVQLICYKLKNFVAQSRTRVYFAQHIFATCNTEICCVASCARGGNAGNNSFNLQCNNLARQGERKCGRITWPSLSKISHKAYAHTL